jgi:hypothetical protein
VLQGTTGSTVLIKKLLINSGYVPYLGVRSLASDSITTTLYIAYGPTNNDFDYKYCLISLKFKNTLIEKTYGGINHV